MKDKTTTIYEGLELEGLKEAINYYQWIVDEFWPYLRGACLEVGAGIGTFSTFLLKTPICSLTCIEPSPNLVPLLQDRLTGGRKPVTIIQSTLQDFANNSSVLFDCIVCLNVLEHIEDDYIAMEHMKNLLKPNGHLCLFVPAHPWLYGTLDESFGHFRRYTKRYLTNLIKETGLIVKSLKFFNFVGVFTWILMGKILHWRTWGRSPVAAYDRLIVPICRSIERFLKPPFGQSLLVVAKNES